MVAIMFTTLFTDEFAPTLLIGVPFLLVILLVYYLRFRNKQAPLEGDAPKPLPIQH